MSAHGKAAIEEDVRRIADSAAALRKRGSLHDKAPCFANPAVWPSERGHDANS